MVVADQCIVFLGAKIYTRTPGKNKTILPYYNFHLPSHLKSEYYVSLLSLSNSHAVFGFDCVRLLNLTEPNRSIKFD